LPPPELGDTHEMSDNLDAPPLTSRMVGEREVHLRKTVNSDSKELNMADTRRDLPPHAVLAVAVGFGAGSRGS